LSEVSIRYKIYWTTWFLAIVIKTTHAAIYLIRGRVKHSSPEQTIQNRSIEGFALQI
jgi:hypothetical protein